MNEILAVRNIFEEVYRDDRWKNGSGPGSLYSSTIEYRAFIERFILDNNIKTVTDLGCGDWQFSRYINWSSVQYTGLDVVPSLIERNNTQFGSETVNFILSESLDSLPGGDLLIAKEMLQHLPNNLVAAYLQVIADRYKYALITNSVAPGHDVNRDIAPGDYRPLRIEASPFNTRGAVVFTYYPKNEHQMWRNTVFLILGNIGSTNSTR